MTKFILTYHGGSMADTPEAQQAAMAAWGEWFGSLGASVLDAGAPAGASATIASDGSVSSGGGANPVTGYSLLDASDLDDAVAKAKGCPVLSSGGSVEVSEALDMG
ncbi:MAG: YCII-related domain protein [Acidimicrobiales bacterium]|nr:YCII-related domain protein [Acidimicrobiales bacterium]